MGAAVPLLILAGASTAYTVSENRRAAGAQQVELDLAKRDEQAQALDREVQRKRRFNAILGSQNAAAAASGVMNSGSVANISLADATLEREDAAIDRNNTANRIDAYSRNRASIGRASNARTATTILGAATSAYGTFRK